jgi:hypothetical protein
MYPRFQNEGMERGERPDTTRMQPARHESRSERVREIRRRVADDAYRCETVADEIARRILMSREL